MGYVSLSDISADKKTEKRQKQEGDLTRYNTANRDTMVSQIRESLVRKDRAVMSKLEMTPYEIDALVMQSMPSYQSRAEKLYDKGKYYQPWGMGNLERGSPLRRLRRGVWRRR